MKPLMCEVIGIVSVQVGYEKIKTNQNNDLKKTYKN